MLNLSTEPDTVDMNCHLFFLINVFIFRERGGEGEGEGEIHQCVVASCTPPTGDLACGPGVCLTGKGTSDPLVHRPTLNPLSYTSQGLELSFMMVDNNYKKCLPWGFSWGGEKRTQKRRMQGK